MLGEEKRMSMSASILGIYGKYEKIQCKTSYVK